MSFNYPYQRFLLTWFVQVIRMLIDRCFTHFCMQQKLIGLLPPKTLPTFNVTRNQENCHRDLHLTCGSKTICIVIVVSIVEGQSQECALLFSLWHIFLRLVEFFQRGLKMEYPVVPA